MKSVSIKGKDYIEVNERVKEFHKLYKNGSIVSQIISNENGVIVFKTTVIPDISTPDRCFTGHAYEKEGSTFINKTSYIENCETSAVGRALGLLGIGIDTSIASKDEVDNAIINQAIPDIDYIDATQLGRIKDFTDNNDGFEARLLKYLKIESLDKIEKKDLESAIKQMEGAK